MDINSVLSISSSNLGENGDALAALLVAAKDGQPEALAEIYELYFKKIYRFIFYRVSHKEVAEDIAEEVFIKAFSRISSIRANATFEGWLYRIAKNLVIDYYRQKNPTVALEEVENTLVYQSNVIDAINLSEQQKILLQILKELGAEQQVVIKLKFLEGLENAEIAELLDKNEGAIRVIQHRAIAKLRELIVKNHQGQKND